MLINNSSTWFLSKRSETIIIVSALIEIDITLTNQLQRAQSLPQNINKQTDTLLPEAFAINQPIEMLLLLSSKKEKFDSFECVRRFSW